jgi:hypothetical protein
MTECLESVCIACLAGLFQAVALPQYTRPQRGYLVSHAMKCDPCGAAFKGKAIPRAERLLILSAVALKEQLVQLMHAQNGLRSL